MTIDYYHKIMHDSLYNNVPYNQNSMEQIKIKLARRVDDEDVCICGGTLILIVCCYMSNDSMNRTMIF